MRRWKAKIVARFGQIWRLSQNLFLCMPFLELLLFQSLCVWVTDGVTELKLTREIVEGRERESVSHTNALPYYTTILYIMIKFHRWLRPLTVRKNETRYRQRYRPVVAAAAVVMALAPNGLSFFFVLHTHSSTGGTKWRRFGESISRSSM